MVRQGAGGVFDAEAIVAWAKARAARGASMRIADVIADPDPAERAMATAVRRHFAGWRELLAAAGITPSGRGRVAPPVPEAAEVLAWVRALAAAGTPLKSSWIGTGPDPTPRRMLAAARRHFGSWARTLTAAGVEAPAERPTREAVVAWLRDVAARRGAPPRSPLELRRDDADPAMVAAARHHFGSWRQALDAAELGDAPAAAPPATIAPRVGESPPPPPPPMRRPGRPLLPAPAPAPAARRWSEVAASPAARWAVLAAELTAALADERHLPPGLVARLAEALAADQLTQVRDAWPAVSALLERQGELLELSAIDARHRELAALVHALAAQGLAVPERLAAFAQAWAVPVARRRRRRR